MFSIGLNFHVIHMTDDNVGLDAWYRDVFGGWTFLKPSYLEHERRDASLLLVGNLCVEPLAPAFAVDDWDSFPLGRFYKRFGTRWHSLAWFLDGDPGELYRALRDMGVRMYGTAGVDQGGDEPVGPIFTHPKDTGTQLEFVPLGRIREMSTDPRFHPAFNPGWWSDRHPLGLLNVSHVTIAVRDAERLTDIYTSALRGTLLHRGEVALTGAASTFVLVGDLVVEIATPSGERSHIADEIEQIGEGLSSVTFKVRDLDAARAHLETRGVAVTATDGVTIHCDPATTHGVQMDFTTWTIPGDPRPDWQSSPS